MTAFRDTLQTFEPAAGRSGKFYSLPALEAAGLGKISRLPMSIRVVLESLLRNCDGKRVREADVRALAAWEPNAERVAEVPFVVARVLLQDFTGVPLLVDMAAMRSAVARMSKTPGVIEPLVPVDLVIDHSVQVDVFGRPDALQKNLEMEFHRNGPRYQFLKWGMQAFETFKIVPPGIGICHQVNLEYLARGVWEKDGVYYPDTLVGTDSHTVMINGLGIVAWGVGGIEAEAAMLGQPIYFLTPDVVGVNLEGRLPEGATATDVVLAVTELLRRTKVVGKFVEFHGEGAAALGAAERATIANMAPEYGATMGFFPVDEETCRYFAGTGRTDEQVSALRAYYQAQGMFGIPAAGQCDYSQVVDLDLAQIKPCLAGPRRPQDRIDLSDMRRRFEELFQAPAPTGYGKSREDLGKRFQAHDGEARPASGVAAGGGRQDPDSLPEGDVGLQSAGNTAVLTEREMVNNRPTPDRVAASEAELPVAPLAIGHGDVLIAAITSCTNTSNPGVMIAAGLVARKAAERGMRVKPYVKTSLAPGSRVVTEYLERTGLQPYLDQIGFNTVGYGCTTCIGNSGPLDPHIDEAIARNDVVAAAVLSGNRNFEARVHQSIKANFLASPPLVVAFALAGTVDVDLSTEPVGKDRDGKDVFLREIWPTQHEVAELLGASMDPAAYRKLYGGDLGAQNKLWADIASPAGALFAWDPDSTYIQEPPYFDAFGMTPAAPPAIKGARALAIFGDSITTDHISPAGSIKQTSPAGKYLVSRGVDPGDFNSYGARRGNHQVMVRGTFANVRIKNLMVPGTEGGVTRHQPDGEQLSIYDAAIRYQAEGTPLMIFAGSEYGTGSSRDWAAKGTRLLGVGAVVAKSFERIHRSNLVGMGVLPLQFKDGVDAQTLGLTGDETFDLEGLDGTLQPRQDVTLVIRRADGRTDREPLTLRIDTPIEVEYYNHGGILPYVLRQLIA
ncbi:MAG: aconitate hydratase [Candidatus Sericytochromatia bacterium]|nr:aconitate hydratase [Candidatus Tanganyikabacteria bacterium]